MRSGGGGGGVLRFGLDGGVRLEPRNSPCVSVILAEKGTVPIFRDFSQNIGPFSILEILKKRTHV